MSDPARTVTATVSLGRLEISADDLARLAAGSVLPLDAAADDRVRILVDGRVVAEGVLLSDGGELVIRVERRA